MIVRKFLLFFFYLTFAVAGAKKGRNTTNTKSGNDEKNRTNSIDSSADHYKYTSDVDQLLSDSIIRSLPITHFFDRDKGTFKMGFLGQELLEFNQSLFRGLVSVIDKKFMQNSVIEVVKNLPVADYSSIFFHFVVALRGAVSRHEYLEQRARGLQNRLTTRLLASEIMHNTTFGNAKTSSSLRLYNEILERKMSAIGKRKSLQDVKSSNHMKNLEYYHDEMRKEIINLHDSLNERIKHKFNTIYSIRMKRNDESLEIFRDAEAKRVEGEVADIATGRDTALAYMSQENIRAMELSKFRLTEEMRRAKDNEDIMLHILEAKTESSIAGFRTILKFAVGELTNVYSSFISNPKETSMYILLILLSFVSTIILYEIVVSFKFVIARFLSVETSRFIRSPIKSKRDNLVFSEKLEKNMNEYLDLLALSSSQQGPLPMMLLYGDSGSGKSSTAEYLVSRSVLPAQVVSVSDVLARDLKEASLFFHKITVGSNKYGIDGFYDQGRKSRKPILIVLDDADDLIESRALRQKAIDSESSVGCFYTLLEAARSASTDVSIILTSRLSPSQIDGALIDRVDFICHLTPPNSLVRFKYILHKFEECFMDIMDDESKTIFLDVAKHDNLDESFRSVVTNSRDTELMAAEMSHPSSSYSSSSSGTVYMISDVSTTSFDVKLCINSLVSHSEGRSYRDIAKFILNTQLMVLGSEDCRIRDIHFMQELRLFLNNLDYYSAEM